MLKYLILPIRKVWCDYSCFTAEAVGQWFTKQLLSPYMCWALGIERDELDYVSVLRDLLWSSHFRMRQSTLRTCLMQTPGSAPGESNWVTRVILWLVGVRGHTWRVCSVWPFILKGCVCVCVCVCDILCVVHEVRECSPVRMTSELVLNSEGWARVSSCRSRTCLLGELFTKNLNVPSL